MKPIRIFGYVIQSQASYDKEIEMAYKDGYDLSRMRLHPGQMVPCNYPKAAQSLVNRIDYEEILRANMSTDVISDLGSMQYAEKYLKDKAI